MSLSARLSTKAKVFWRKKFNREVISEMISVHENGCTLEGNETLDEFKEHLQFQVMSDHIRWKSFEEGGSIDGNWHFLWHYEAKGDEFPDLDETKSNEGLNLKALLIEAVLIDKLGQ